jgi:hypothetical protein
MLSPNWTPELVAVSAGGPTIGLAAGASAKLGGSGPGLRLAFWPERQGSPGASADQMYKLQQDSLISTLGWWLFGPGTCLTLNTSPGLPDADVALRTKAGEPGEAHHIPKLVGHPRPDRNTTIKH